MAKVYYHSEHTRFNRDLYWSFRPWPDWIVGELARIAYPRLLAAEEAAECCGYDHTGQYPAEEEL